MSFLIEFCPTCGRHARMKLVEGGREKTEVHVACKEHALLFIRKAVTEGGDIRDEEISRLVSTINSSRVPALEKATEKRLYHIEVVNLNLENFRNFPLDKLCITILLISPKRIPKNYKKSVVERFQSVRPN